MATMLQAAECRAQEAEEEQYRAEQEAAAANAELRSSGGGAAVQQVQYCSQFAFGRSNVEAAVRLWPVRSRKVHPEGSLAW